jgi:hypothetical protein
MNLDVHTPSILSSAGGQVAVESLHFRAPGIGPGVASAELAFPDAEVVILVIGTLGEDGGHAEPNHKEESKVQGNTIGVRRVNGVLEVLEVRVLADSCRHSLARGNGAAEHC